MSFGPAASDPSALGDQLGPAWAAAQRSSGRTGSSRGTTGYRRTQAVVDPAGDSVVLHATRAMYAACSRAEVAVVLHAAINDLGGAVVPARLAGPDSVPVDVALGVGEPKVVMVVEPMDPAHLRIAHHLPLLVEDAKVAAARCDAQDRESRRLRMDALTGVAGRRSIGPRLAATRPGTVACMLGVDGLGALGDADEHSAAEAALSGFALLLLGSVRADDFVSRSGGEEFLALVEHAPLSVTRERLRDLVAQWSAGTGGALTVSGGLAVVDARGAVVAVRAADGARERARRSGSNRMELAIDDDYDDSPMPFGEPR